MKMGDPCQTCGAPMYLVGTGEGSLACRNCDRGMPDLPPPAPVKPCPDVSQPATLCVLPAGHRGPHRARWGDHTVMWRTGDTTVQIR